MQQTLESEDSTVLIWEYLFKARIPEIASRHPEEMKLLGTRVSGVKEIDKDIHSQWLTTMLSIDQMVDLYKRGVAVRVVHYDDTKTIYDYISKHIYIWKDRLEKGINVGNAPIDDLIAMDEFANLVYDHARHLFTREIADSILNRHIAGIMRFNPNSFFNHNAIKSMNTQNNNGVVHINKDPDPTTQDRDSLGEFFKSRLITMRNSRR